MVNAAVNVKTFKTDRRRQGIVYNGFRYPLDKRRADGCMFWRCVDQRSCEGRLTTDDEDLLAILRIYARTDGLVAI
jgi:FLYWCH zinc finger domain